MTQSYVAGVSTRDMAGVTSTVIRLHELLKKAFPACRTNHAQAALKLPGHGGGLTGFRWPPRVW